MKKLYCFLTACLAVASTAHSQNYCDFTSCLFWEEQAEPILGDTVIYAANEWSIDEWDNISCTFPVQQCENLRLEVYYADLPAGEMRPLVVLIHGGAFISGSRAAFREQAKELARLGYVAATIDYRLCKRNNCLFLNWVTGILPPFDFICNLNFWSDFGQSAYVAVHDAHNAIRFLQEHAADYHIDPEAVIVGGHSAGGWTALHLAYLDQDESDSMPGGPGFKNLWGAFEPVDGIIGVFNMAGAFFDTTFIDADEDIPAFLVHGACDPVVCYDFDAPFHCNASYPAVHGCADLASRMHHLGHDYYLFTGIGMGHDVDPLSDIWYPELLRFLRETVLCQQPLQKHSLATLDPVSLECAILEEGNLQHTHPPREPVDLPLSALWDTLPCGLVIAVGERPKEPAWQVFPNPSANGQVVVEATELMAIELYTLSGRMLWQGEAGPGRSMINLPPQAGVYLLIGRKRNGTRSYRRVVRL